MKSRVLVFSGLLIFTISLHGQPRVVSSFEFRKADSLVELYPRHSLKDLRLLSDKLTASLSTEEGKFRAIYAWVCKNIDNDFDLYINNKRKREKLSGEKLVAWNKEFSQRVFRVLTDQHKTVCTGYAYLVRKLALYSGLSCEIIHGYGRTSQANIGGPGIANHSWNAILLNNTWYLCDATWSSGALNMETSTFVRKFDDSYFLADPAYFIRNHYPLDSTWMLLDDPPTMETFLNSPLIYVNALRYQMLPVTPQSFDMTIPKGEKISFQLTKNGGADIERVDLRIGNTRSRAQALMKVKDEQSLLYSIDYIFSIRGTYAVHVAADDQYVVSYRVRVR